MISILRIGSLRSPPPFRLRRTSPRESVSHDSQVALLPYESCSLATPSGGPNKTPRDNLLTWYMNHWGGRSLGSEHHGSGSRLPPYRHAAPLEMTILAGSIGHAFDVRVQRVQRVVLSPSRAMSFIGLPGRPTPSTTGVVPLPLQAGGGKFTGARRLFNPPLLSVFSPTSLPVWRRRE